MSTITTRDGTTIYYKGWGKGPVVTLSRGTRSNTFKGLWAAVVAIVRRPATAATSAASTRTGRRSSNACPFAEFLDDRIRFVE